MQIIVIASRTRQGGRLTQALLSAGSTWHARPLAASVCTEEHPLVRTLQEEFRAVTGKELPCAYDASVCDSNILAVVLGIPTVTFGPAGGNMHGDDEYGYAWQVKNCGEIYRRTVARLLAEQA